MCESMYLLGDDVLAQLVWCWSLLYTIWVEVLSGCFFFLIFEGHRPMAMFDQDVVNMGDSVYIDVCHIVPSLIPTLNILLGLFHSGSIGIFTFITVFLHGVSCVALNFHATIFL